MRTGKDTMIIKRGFTLTEATIAMVVLAMAAAGVLLPFASGARVRADGVQRTLAAKLAGDQMQQIVVTDFDEIINTYNGYSEQQGQVKNAAGEVFTDPAYANFSRDVTCQYVNVAQQSDNADNDFILITVTVYYEGTKTAELHRLISR